MAQHTALIFDFGGPVLLTPFELRHVGERDLGLAPGTFAWTGPFDPAADADWRAFQAGEMNEREYWAIRAAEFAELTGGDGNDLVDAFIRIIDGLRPQAVVIENVRAIATEYKGRYRDYIIARLKEVGSTVNATEPVYFLINPETIWVRAFVDESLAGALAVGQTAWVRLRSNPHEAVEAEIVRLRAEVERLREELRVTRRTQHETPPHYL